MRLIVAAVALAGCASTYAPGPRERANAPKQHPPSVAAEAAARCATAIGLLESSPARLDVAGPLDGLRLATYETLFVAKREL